MRPDNESSAEPRLQPVAFIADAARQMPETWPELLNFSATTGNLEHPAVQLGVNLLRKAVDAIVRREFDYALGNCCDTDLLLVAQAIRLCRELHGEDSIQNGMLTAAYLQTLGFGAGHVSRSEEGGELTVELAQGWRETCGAASGN
jgi:hypothetical protein